MFRTLVLQGNMLPDDSSPIRVFLFTWYMFGIIMYALYSGSLTSFLTKPFLERPINTLQDLKESSRRGFVPAVQPSTSQEILLKNAETGIFRELWELMEPGRSFPESGLQAMEKVLTENIVYASGSLNLEIRASQTGRHKFYISSDTFLPQMYGIACFPGAPFKDKFSIMLDRMVEGGLVARWIKDEIHKLKGSGQDAETEQLEQGKETRSLALDHLQGAFFILAGGCLMSTIFFLAEIMRHQATSPLYRDHSSHEQPRSPSLTVPRNYLQTLLQYVALDPLLLMYANLHQSTSHVCRSLPHTMATNAIQLQPIKQ
ncbi:hypothetical protein O3P69_006680 [Scylla paramamosain]|uniref:Ionotropic glutamate receptor C-terminal domain-containing protein n=1 Tax=Scylla paramamosain TaxID=85552 RepID=A0AAW0U0E8_SCYPA